MEINVTNIAELIAKAAKEKTAAEAPDSEKMRVAARKAAAKKMMAALKADDDETFLAAMAELKETE